MLSRKKIKFEKEPTLWEHHRGGWSHAFCSLKGLTVEDGILCVSTLEEVIFKYEEDEVANEVAFINEPWVGFIHQVPRNNCPYYPDLQRLVENACFLKSLDFCKGIFVISGYVKNYLLKHLPEPERIPIAQLVYPITPFPENKRFDWETFRGGRNVYFIGQFLRNFQSIYDLVVPKGYRKYLIKASDVDFDDLYDMNQQKYKLRPNDSVTLVNSRVSNDDYDDILSSSVVFLHLFDAAANTIVLECLGRGTPLIVNKLPGVVEYLGSDYPLYFNTLEEASKLLEDDALLLKATEYFKTIDKTKFQTSSFVDGFVKSSIYRSLPLPPSQQSDSRQTQFPKVALTVMICSYKRVYNLKRLLQCFTEQDYKEEFEIILWNNNNETQSEVAEIVKLFEGRLKVTLIQSSKNFYCIVRLTVPKLMQSDLLLICDDDVVPKSNYITTFISSFNKHGPRAVLCFRGHVFRQHSLNHEEPNKFWEDYEEMKFFDQNTEDRQVLVIIINDITIINYYQEPCIMNVEGASPMFICLTVCYYYIMLLLTRSTC